MYSLKQCNELEKDTNKQLMKVQGRMRKLLKRETELYGVLENVTQRRKEIEHRIGNGIPA